MAYFIDKIGLDFLVENEEGARGLMSFAASEGTPILGYRGYPYFNMHLGDAELVLRSALNEEKERLEILGMDTHVGGPCIWNVRLTGIDMNRKDGDIMERRCVVSKKEDGSGLAVVNILNADVLPSFDKGEEYELQMVAFPLTLNYFKDEEEYAASQPKSEMGKTFLLADGSVLPSGMLRNRDPESDEFESDENMDDWTMIRGTVKKLYRGEAEIGGHKFDSHIQCIIDTEFGELEIVHTIDDVEESQRKNLRVGAIVSGVFFLSADAAINEYENGFVLDEKNNFRILRSVIAGADEQRLKSVFAEDAIYNDQYDLSVYEGREAVIKQIKADYHEYDLEVFAHMATVELVDDDGDPCPYEVGRRCIMLAFGEEDAYANPIFIDMNEEGKITRMVRSIDRRLHIKVDEKPKAKSPFDDIPFPESVATPMIARAHYHGIVDEDVSDEEILNAEESVGSFEENAEQMVALMPNREKETFENLFGYLFAKAIEGEYSDKHPKKPNGLLGAFRSVLIVSYTPRDAWAGRITTLLDAAGQQKIKKAMKLGKQFYKDFAFLHPQDEEEDDTYESDLMTALLLVQRLGKLYEPKLLES